MKQLPFWAPPRVRGLLVEAARLYQLTARGPSPSRPSRSASMIHPHQLGEAYPVHWDTTMPSARLLRPIASRSTVRAVEPEVFLQPPIEKIEEHHQPQPLEHSLPTVGGLVHTSVWDPQCVTATLASPELSFCVAPRLRPSTTTPCFDCTRPMRRSPC